MSHKLPLLFGPLLADGTVLPSNVDGVSWVSPFKKSGLSSFPGPKS